MQKHFAIGVGLAGVLGLAIGIAQVVNPDYGWIAAHGGWWWLVGAFVLFAALWVLIARWWDSTRQRLKTDGSQPPSEYDQKLFEELLRLFPLDEGTMGWLDIGFFGLSWKTSQTYPIFDFEAVYEKKYFDNQYVNEALTELRNACGLLGSWLVDEQGEEVPLEDRDYLYRVKTAKVRRSTQEEYVEAVREGERLGHDVVRARIELEKVGRREGLRPPI